MDDCTSILLFIFYCKNENKKSTFFQLIILQIFILTVFEKAIKIQLI